MITGLVAAGAATALGIAGTVVAQAQETGDEALAEAIDAILADARLTDSQVGVVVADADTGDILYDHNGDKRANAGSNNKIATAAAALETLGADYTYTTDVIGDRPEDGVVDGDLYVRGSGDPTMLEADYDALAAELADNGVSRIDGDLVADDTAFDDERLGKWEWGDLQYLYASEVSALTIASGDDLNAGTVRVFVDPGAGEGDPASISMTPANDYVTVVNDAVTGAAGSGTSVSINRDKGGNTVRVTGTVAEDSNGTYGTRAVIDPAGLAASVFEDALADNGITVAGDVRTGETTPQGEQVLASRESKPLSELMAGLLKPSNSSHAEALLKTMGYEASGEGTFSSGKAALYAAIEKYGVDTGPIRFDDGSGLSRQNLISPAMITDLLVGAKDATWFDTWYDALPIACEDGTLASRMCGTPAAGNVHAKTGSLTSVSALSGFATDADGRELAFSIMTNDFLYWTVKDIEDQIAATIAGNGADSSESEIATFSNLERIEEPQIPAEVADEDQIQMECSWVEPAVC
nr:D-alanyl-D-alanine carboxypeptidase/D-alanyl-D-alanine-endopeptidase [Glycomyces sp. L485]